MTVAKGWASWRRSCFATGTTVWLCGGRSVSCVGKVNTGMSQEKSAEIIDLSASRAAAAGDGAGPFLMSARLAAGIEVEEAAAATKIKPAHIEAIETGNTAALPATPYAVGFVKVYAAYLGLDADAIAAEFRREVMSARPEPERPVRAAPAPSYETSPSVKVGSLFGIALILAFAIWIGIQIAGNNNESGGASADDVAPRVRLSEIRAEAPRPRVVSASDYEVVPIPPVGSAPAEETPLDDLTAPSAPADEAAVEPVTLAPAIIDEPVASGGEALPTATPAFAEPAPEPVVSPAAATPAQPAPTVIDARLIRSIGPQYPARCEPGAAAFETVSVIFDVNATGRPTNPRVTATSNDCFEDAAVAAISKWRFDPRTVGGAPRPQKNVEATLNFRR